jgi:ubiquinone/menaquinone biosynthesis C-methylase UbiE
LVEYIRPYLDGNDRIPDVGCGPGLVGQELERTGWSEILIGADIAENRLREAKRKSIYTDCVVADADRLPFRDAGFDIVLSNAMVGLTGNRSVRQMHRLVRTGGYLGCVLREIKSFHWCRTRFRKALQCFAELPRMRLLSRKDLGTGYVNTDYDDEHSVCLILRKS